MFLFINYCSDTFRDQCLAIFRELVSFFFLSRYPDYVSTYLVDFNPLNTKRRMLYLKTQFVPRSKHFHLGYKNPSVYAVSGTSRCLFSDKYKTHKYIVGRTYSCWMLNCWCITQPVGFKRLMGKHIVRKVNHACWETRYSCGLPIRIVP